MVVFTELEEFDLFGEFSQYSTDLVVETNFDFAGFGVTLDEGLETLVVVDFFHIEFLMPFLNHFLDELLLGKIVFLTVFGSWFGRCLFLLYLAFHLGLSSIQ